MKLPVSSLIQNYSDSSPYPIKILREDPWYDFTRHNGYMSLAKRLMLKIVTDMDTARDVWNVLTTNRTLFDLWDVRQCFYDSYNIEPYFITVYHQDGIRQEPVGVLPLWFDLEYFPNTYTWFGGYWPEENKFFVKDPELIPLMLMVTPNPTILECISPLPEYDFLKSLHGFGRDKDETYIMDLTKYSTLDSYLSSLKKKKRYNIKRDRKHILHLRPNVVVDNLSHLEELFRLNIDRFRHKSGEGVIEKSIFENPSQKKLFQMLMTHARSVKPRLISTVINGKIEAVEAGLIYGKTYYALSSGANITEFSGLGVYSNLLVIEDAMRNGCTKIDFLEGDYNWKHSWNLQSYFQYRFAK